MGAARAGVPRPGQGEEPRVTCQHPAVPRVQICLHEGAACHPDTRDQADTDYLRAFLTRFIRAKFPGVEARVAVEESCMYTMTPDENPVIDTVPGTNIVIGVGFSGNNTCSLGILDFSETIIVDERYLNHGRKIWQKENFTEI